MTLVFKQTLLYVLLDGMVTPFFYTKAPFSVQLSSFN
jgi:hypothetical protein